MDHPIQCDGLAVSQFKRLAEHEPEGPLKELLGHLASEPETFTRKNAVLNEFRRTLGQCRAYDPLQKEALVTSLETILEILRIESSDGLLNEWLHGISL